MPVAGVQIALGTVAFGLTFTLRDRLHAAGRRVVYTTIASGTVLSALAALATGVPLRISAASCVVILIAESADTEIFQALWRRSWLVRALSSNAVSIPLDTLLFTLLAFGGVLAARDMWQLVVGDTLLKFLIGGVLAWTFRRS